MSLSDQLDEEARHPAPEPENNELYSAGPKLRRMKSQNPSMPNRYASNSKNPSNSFSKDTARFTKDSFLKKKPPNRSSESVQQILGSQHASPALAPAPAKAPQKFRETHSGSIQPIRAKNPQGRREANSIVTAMPVLEQSAWKTGLKDDVKEKDSEDSEDSGSKDSGSKDSQARRPEDPFLVEVATNTQGLWGGRDAVLRDAWVQTEGRVGFLPDRRSSEANLLGQNRRASAAMIQLSNKPLMPFNQERLTGLRRILTEQDENLASFGGDELANVSTLLPPSAKAANGLSIPNPQNSYGALERVDMGGTQSGARAKLTKTASELFRPRMSLIKEQPKKYRMRTVEGQGSSDGLEMCEDSVHSSDGESEDMGSPGGTPPRQLPGDKLSRTGVALAPHAASSTNIPCLPSSCKRDSRSTKLHRRQHSDLLERIDLLAGNLKALRKEHRLVECVQELADSLRGGRLGVEGRELAGALVVTRTNLIPLIKQLKAAHGSACKASFCHHLQRFYDSLKKIAAGYFNTKRKVLELKPLEIHKIEHRECHSSNKAR